MLMSLLGGLAIFLFGMDQMTATLKALGGDRMKAVLARLTTNRFTAVLAGAFVTCVIQSSSVTTVLVVGFVSVGIMTLSQSIGVIMGAEIGTTITAQIIAFKVTNSALAIVATGFAIQFLSGQERLRQYGTMILGFGLLFFGMNVMSDATAPLRSYEPFIESVQRLNAPVWGILLAAGFTAVIQSSSATTVLVIILSEQNVLSLEQAIPLIFGANIGTCVTGLLAAIGKPREAVRTSMVHVTFNVIGVLLWYGFIDDLAWLVRQMSEFTPRQIAHAHTIFNVSNTCILIWFTTPLARLVTFLVPKRVVVPAETMKPIHLDEILLQTPAMALDTVRIELGRLGVTALHMVRGSLEVALNGKAGDLNRLAQRDDDVDSLHAAIVTYLGQLSRENLTAKQSQLLHDYLLAANYFENIGDTIESNLVIIGRHRLEQRLVISPSTQTLMRSVHQKVCQAIDHAVRAIVEKDPTVAQQVIDAKDDFNQLVDVAEDHLTHRLGAGEPKRLEAFRLESEIMEYMKRMYYFAKRIAKLIVMAGEFQIRIPPNDGATASDTAVVGDTGNAGDAAAAAGNV